MGSVCLSGRPPPTSSIWSPCRPVLIWCLLLSCPFIIFNFISSPHPIHHHHRHLNSKQILADCWHVGATTGTLLLGHLPTSDWLACTAGKWQASMRRRHGPEHTTATQFTIWARIMLETMWRQLKYTYPRLVVQIKQKIAWKSRRDNDAYEWNSSGGNTSSDGATLQPVIEICLNLQPGVFCDSQQHPAASVVVGILFVTFCFFLFLVFSVFTFFIAALLSFLRMRPAQ